MPAYYNEIEPFAVNWLRNLIAAGHIPPGDVDDRSIKEVKASDLEGYDQCHFFAGVGGWPLALRYAGWPDDRPVWTGSCPCQPFSVAGKGEGVDDPRHLWPELYRLFEKRRPTVVLGEQVAGAAKWLNLVRGNLEALDYAVGAMPIEAASAGADHFRDRYWFVADNDFERSCEKRQQRSGQSRGPSGDTQNHPGALADRPCERRNGLENIAEPTGRDGVQIDGNCALVDAPGVGWGEGWTEHELGAAVASIGDSQYVECPDGKWRRLPPPGVRWLGTGVPARVAKLRAIGNAIDWRPAAAFIGAYMEIGAE